MSLIRQLVILSVFFAALMLVIPEGSVRRLTAVLCTVILFTVILDAVSDFDFESYAATLAGYRDMGSTLEEDSMRISKELNRTVIENNCNAYIMDKGKGLGLDLREVKVKLQWSMDGVWYPIAVEISSGSEKSSELTGLIEAELGIPENAIEWKFQ